MEAPAPQVAVRLLRFLLAALAQVGGPSEQVRTQLGLDECLLADDEARVSANYLLDFWRLAEAASGDATIGLKVGAAVPFGARALADYLVRNCQTLAQAIDRGSQVARLLDDTANFSAGRTGDSYRVVIQGPAELVLRDAHWDYAVSRLLTTFRDLTRCHLVPTQVCFMRAPPKDRRPYHRLLGCDVVFGARSHLIEGPAAWAALPIPGADGALLDILNRHATELIGRLPTSDSFVDHVRSAIAEELRRGVPQLGGTAARLHLGARTLRRRLVAEGQSFQALVDELRLEMAQRYLRDSDHSIDSIAELLGFSQGSAFGRAFKRWTAESPVEYRRRARGGALQ